MALSLQKHNNAPKTTALCNSCLKSVINQTFVFRNTSWTWYLIQILLVESGGRLADGSFTIAWLPWDLNTKKLYIRWLHDHFGILVWKQNILTWDWILFVFSDRILKIAIRSEIARRFHFWRFLLWVSNAALDMKVNLTLLIVVLKLRWQISNNGCPTFVYIFNKGMKYLLSFVFFTK